MLERKNALELHRKGVDFLYEPCKIPYEVPTRTANYNPDLIINKWLVVEIKGRFVTKDRQKHLLFKKEHPDIVVRFVFSNPEQTISKQSKTTYAKWCEDNGYLYAKGTVPQEWIDESTNKQSRSALRRYLP